MTGDIDKLRRFSALWGSDMMLVQGAGGNTSLKADADLVIKASGKRLSDALTQDIFLRMPLESALAGGSPPGGRGLRPSIETFMHALMPHRVVAHLHMVDAIAHGVRVDAKAALGAALNGLAWGMIDYRKPGLALAEALRALLSDGVPDVVVLANHGILIGADSFEAAHAIVGDVAARLAAPERTGPLNATGLQTLAGMLGLEPARLPQAHLAAATEASFRHATAGTLYPDHVVFLGRGAGHEGRADESSLYLAPGLGALVTPGLSDAAHEMAACLGLVVSRIPEHARVTVLTRAQEDELINWDAEAYRRTLSGETGQAAGAAR